MHRSCGDSPVEEINDYDENSEFIQNIQSNNGSSINKLEPRWIKLCNEGYKFDNGEHLVNVKCSQNHDWTLANGYPIPR